jgi:hypothetical protein
MAITRPALNTGRKIGQASGSASQSASRSGFICAAEHAPRWGWGLNYTVILFAIVGGLFAGSLGMLEIGRRIGARRAALDPEGARDGSGALDGAVFALLGLLIAFTFSGAMTRFEARRDLLTEEVNAIGTAWLRIDLLRPDAQAALRDKFRRYLDSRIETYRRVPDMQAVQEELARSVALQNEIWSDAVAGSQGAPPPAAMLLLPALNQMIDITTTRLVATQAHPPGIVFAMLVTLTLAASLLAGYSLTRTRWLHMVAFALTMSLTAYVIFDVEYPRIGLIRIDAADQVLVDLRRSLE